MSHSNAPEQQQQQLPQHVGLGHILPSAPPGTQQQEVDDHEQRSEAADMMPGHHEQSGHEASLVRPATALESQQQQEQKLSESLGIMLENASDMMAKHHDQHQQSGHEKDLDRPAAASESQQQQQQQQQVQMDALDQHQHPQPFRAMHESDQLLMDSSKDGPGLMLMHASSGNGHHSHRHSLQERA